MGLAGSLTCCVTRAQSLHFSEPLGYICQLRGMGPRQWFVGRWWLSGAGQVGPGGPPPLAWPQSASWLLCMLGLPEKMSFE